MATEHIDFVAEGLLDGLEGEQRSERLALLEQLAADGVPLAELRRATAAGTLLFLPTDRMILGTQCYTAAAGRRAERGRARLPAAARDARWACRSPSPTKAAYTDADLESAKMLHVARDAGISDEDVLELLRVLGRGLAQAAESLRDLPLKLVLQPGISEHDLAHRYTRARRAALSAARPAAEQPARAAPAPRHRERGDQRDGALRGRLPGSREVAVCFADLVGFTRLGEEVPPDELGRARGAPGSARHRGRRRRRCGWSRRSATPRCSPRPSREPLLDAALALIEAADAEGSDFPQLRAGAALGLALPRAGDWFGRPVNLASRITSIARPGSLLAARELHDSAPEGYRWSFAGERRLRGIREPVALYRARRAGRG